MRSRSRVAHGRSLYAIGQHDTDLPRRRPLDEVERELPARTASESHAQPISDLLRDRRRIRRPRLRRELSGCCDELMVGDAIAQANVHGLTKSTRQGTDCKWE